MPLRTNWPLYYNYVEVEDSKCDITVNMFFKSTILQYDEYSAIMRTIDPKNCIIDCINAIKHRNAAFRCYIFHNFSPFRSHHHDLKSVPIFRGTVFFLTPKSSGLVYFLSPQSSCSVYLCHPFIAVLCPFHHHNSAILRCTFCQLIPAERCLQPPHSPISWELLNWHPN